MKDFKKRAFLVYFFLFILILSEIIPLSGDEAYYFDCSKNLDWSYFDQPPLVIWLTGIFTSIFKSNLTVRLPSVFFTLLTLILLYKWKKEEGENLFLIFSTAPLIFFGSFYLSTDRALSFFYLWATYLIIKIDEENSNFLWFLLGLAFGLGFLSKFPMVLILPLIFYISYKRANLFQFFLFSIISFITVLPILIYGFQNDWANFTFQLALRHKESSNFFKMFTNLWLPNLILMGPIFFIRGLYLSFKNFKKNLILFISGLIPLIFFTLSGFKNPGAPHWLSLGFLPLALLQIENWKGKILKISLFLNIFIIICFLFVIFLPQFFFELNPKTLQSFVNFKELSKKILEERVEGEVLISKSYTLVALLNYHLKERVYLFNVDRGIHGLSYLYWQKKEKFKERNYLLVSNKKLSPKSLIPYFEEVNFKKFLIRKGKISKEFYLYHCKNIKDGSPFYP
ncbi:MAG: glycosyltransferase family 39 protein [Thermoanaerobaculia bacterium]